MRSIYLKKLKKRCKNCGNPVGSKSCLNKMGCLAEPVKAPAPVKPSPKKHWYSVLDCRSCGGPQLIKPVGYTMDGEPLYSCGDSWHVRIGQ